jgi:alanine dehydrogenase
VPCTMHAMLILTQRDVARLLPMRACINLMRETLAALSEGRATVPQRRYVPVGRGRGTMGMMPADLPLDGVAGLKVITVYPANEGSAFDSHRGAVLLFEVEHGGLLAAVDATAITAIRTAAVSGLATEMLARRGADDLAIIGSGTEAATHLAAMLDVRPIRRVRVFSRTRERAIRFAAACTQRHDVPITVCGTVEEAVRDAAIICTTTSAATPVVSRSWIASGAHINAIGSSVATDRELDTLTVADATLIVDLRASAELEAGEFVIAKNEGAIGNDHIAAELGDVVVGRHPGRRSPDELTVFKSVGLGIEDVAAAAYVYRCARELGMGLRVDFGGRNHALFLADAGVDATQQ